MPEREYRAKVQTTATGDAQLARLDARVANELALQFGGNVSVEVKVGRKTWQPIEPEDRR